MKATIGDMIQCNEYMGVVIEERTYEDKSIVFEIQWLSDVVPNKHAYSSISLSKFISEGLFKVIS